MSRKKTNKTFDSGSKPVGLRLGLEMIDKWDKIAHELEVSKALVIESALYHFINLPKSQQKELLKQYLTKDL
jgi:predicted transcriptional regulator